MNRPRFVFDTNVLVSVILSPSSVSRTAAEKADQIGELFFSEATVSELESVLSRSKFDRYVPLAERLAFARLLVDRSMVLEVFSDFKVCRDPKDDMLLQLAVDAGASCIVTRDNDLLVLHPFRGIPILNAATFLQTF